MSFIIDTKKKKKCLLLVVESLELRVYSVDILFLKKVILIKSPPIKKRTSNFMYTVCLSHTKKQLIRTGGQLNGT